MKGAWGNRESIKTLPHRQNSDDSAFQVVVRGFLDALSRLSIINHFKSLTLADSGVTGKLSRVSSMARLDHGSSPTTQAGSTSNAPSRLPASCHDSPDDIDVTLCTINELINGSKDGGAHGHQIGAGGDADARSHKYWARAPERLDKPSCLGVRRLGTSR